jgi:hypothetical protein
MIGLTLGYEPMVIIGARVALRRKVSSVRMIFFSGSMENLSASMVR